MALIVPSHAPLFSANSVATEVAKKLYEHREFIAGGARSLWNYLYPPKAGGSNKKSKGRYVALGGGKTRSSLSQTATAYSNEEHQSTYWNESSLQKHVEYGSGVRVVGRQYLCDVTTTAGDSQLFSGATGINTQYISPDGLGSRLALIARCYNVYVFRHFRVCYMTRVATTQAGAACMAYVQDGSLTGFQTVDYATSQQIEDNVKFAFREPGVFLEMNYFGDHVWYTEVDTTDNASVRQTVQGRLVGYPDASSIGALKMGDLMIEYVVDLYSPVSDFGFTAVDRLSLPTRKLISNYLLDLEDEVPDGTREERERYICSTLQKMFAPKALSNTPPLRK